MIHERYSTRVTLRTVVNRKNTFGRKMRENAVISSKYDFRHQRLTVSPICALDRLEDEVDSVVLKWEEYAFRVYQDLSDVASQLEKRKRQHRPNQLRLGRQVLQVPRGENLQKNLHFHHLFSFNL